VIVEPSVGSQPQGCKDDCDERKEDDHPDFGISSLALAACMSLPCLLWRTA
jgi:hypothetical protein